MNGSHGVILSMFQVLGYQPHIAVSGSNGEAINLDGMVATLEYSTSSIRPATTYYGEVDRVEAWATKLDRTLVPATKLPNIPASKIPNISQSKLPNIPVAKMPARVVVTTAGSGAATVSSVGTKTQVLQGIIHPLYSTSKVLIELYGGVTQIGTPAGNNSSGGTTGTYTYELIRSGLVPAVFKAVSERSERTFDGERKEGAISHAHVDSPSGDTRYVYSLNWGASGGYTFKHTPNSQIVMVLTEVPQ